MELVLKTSDGVKPTVSSNLTLSAKRAGIPMGCLLFSWVRFEESNVTVRGTVAGDGLTEPNLYFRKSVNANESHTLRQKYQKAIVFWCFWFVLILYNCVF